MPCSWRSLGEDLLGASSLSEILDWGGRVEGGRKAGRKFPTGGKFSPGIGEKKGLKFGKQHKMAIQNKGRIDRLFQNGVFLKAIHSYFFKFKS